MKNWVALVTVALVSVLRVSAEEFELARQTMGGGGLMWSQGGDFEFSGTIGQPGAGTMSGGDIDLTGGFWFEVRIGDCNDTGCVNLLDYADLEACLSGPDGGLPAPECNCFDIDGDNDVDLLDSAQFQHSFTGG
jgi:hypothetical protein